MNYNKNYKAEDFVLDHRFRKWVLDPDEEDNLYWERWLQKYPHHAEKVNEARSILLRLPKVEYKFNKKAKDNLWESILEDSGKEHQRDTGKSHKVIPLYTEQSFRSGKRKPGGFTRAGLKIAAGISILLVTSLFIFNKSLFQKDQSNIQVEKIVKRNPLGQKSTIFLGDGSEVILNSGSALTFYDDFGKKDRILYLEGEAFFKVAKKEQPFKVISNGLTTTALGTSFNVKSFGGITKVALVTGKVRVEKNDNNEDNTDTLMLIPGEQAVFSGKDTALVKNTFNLKQETGWKDGVIFFKDAKSEEVFTYLEKWYGVEITEVNRSAKSWNYSGEFKDMSLYRVLSSIGFTMNFEFSMEDKHVKITYLN